MRRPAQISPWLTRSEMRQWVRSASDKSAYQRRLAVWLTREARFSAQRVAALLAVSTQAVWKWVGEYNKSGPTALERKGRGGRRRGLMGIEEEREFLSDQFFGIRQVVLPSEEELRQAMSEACGRELSLTYVRRLLDRHSLRDLFRAKNTK
jgi:transposase